ncbi:DAK2 domain-containing protein [Aldersonia sp. NBC_00410]|uniref:DAK2 domain-containing protein n=1 Tax=Aldersonia sp. NBC_00410 TaxID=2975954 RepID=UPI0022579E1E|nr:DAK2 domain-containing protein [Aldersonia sp. NBC_00410]MCX5046148.1 DAK2 domain-containing protein [Aldersonia sp. NBC_00410]
MFDVLATLDGDAVVRWGQACVDGLTDRCDEINGLNVFPVADSDTGTNLLFTMRSAMDAVARRSAGTSNARDVLARMASGATIGARGNSGIFLSQVLRGIAEVSPEGPMTASLLRAGLDTAVSVVRRAVNDPVEGTIVTVLEASAAAVRHCPDETPLIDIATTAAEAAAAALELTTAQLDVLGAAGVVDAGGRGLLVLLDSLVSVISGSAPHRRRFDPATQRIGRAYDVGAAQSDDLEYEVMYLIADADQHGAELLRKKLDRIGDSVLVVSDGSGGWSSHVHCTEPGAAIEAGLSIGRLHQIRISCFSVAAGISDRLPTDRHTPAHPVADRGILAVVSGDGAAELFEAEGATVLRCDGELRAIELLAAIKEMSNREVLVLPNGTLAAQELVAVGVAARDADHDVLLLPASSMVQGLASLAVHDPGRVAVDDIFAMSEAAAATRWGSLRVSSERALTVVGTCEPGDGLGLVGQEVVVIRPDVREAGTLLIDRVLGLGGELVTLLVGARTPVGLLVALERHIAEHHSGVDVIVYRGGQDGDLFQFGVE